MLEVYVISNVFLNVFMFEYFILFVFRLGILGKFYGLVDNGFGLGFKNERFLF